MESNTFNHMLEGGLKFAKAALRRNTGNRQKPCGGKLGATYRIVTGMREGGFPGSYWPTAMRIFSPARSCRALAMPLSSFSDSTVVL